MVDTVADGVGKSCQFKEIPWICIKEWRVLDEAASCKKQGRTELNNKHTSLLREERIKKLMR
jgi:hypothetical protein